MSSDGFYMQATGVIIDDGGDGIVAFSQDQAAMHCLNTTAADILSQCAAPRTAAEIAEEIRATYGLPAPPVDDVTRCLAALCGAGLVQRHDQPPPQNAPETLPPT